MKKAPSVAKRTKTLDVLRPRMEKAERPHLIYSAEGERGVTTGRRYRCRMGGCPGTRIEVMWTDGKRTRPCSRGMKPKLGPIYAWKIE